MQANTDLSLNNSFTNTPVLGGQPRIVVPQVGISRPPYGTLLLEPGFNAYAAFRPTNMQTVIAVPAVIPTAAAAPTSGNPYDSMFGAIGFQYWSNNVSAIPLPPQTSPTSFS